MSANVRKKLLWKLSTLALAFLLLAILALIGPDTSYETAEPPSQRAAWALGSDLSGSEA